MRSLLAALLFASVVIAAGTLEVERGDLRLVLHEDTARHSLYLRTESEWIPLFVADDPRTSVLEILENNRVHRLGDSGTFQQIAEETADGARFVWTSPTLRIVQTFRFTRSVGAARFNAVEMTIAITNEGEEPSLVGARLIYDTYLGERTNVHFVTPGTSKTSRETSLAPGPVNRYIASATSPEASFGFQISLENSITRGPRAAVAANWKRLIDSSWDYAVNEDRNFNRLPYSINDSAIMIVFPTEQLGAGERYAVGTYLGDLAPDGYLSPEIATETGGRDELLERVAEVVAQINALLQSDSIDPLRVTALEEELRTLTSQVRGR